MTIINPKSIAGVTSITTPSGSDNLFTVHTNNTTERIRINNDGDVIVGSGITVSSDGDIFATGVCTATSFVGSGANLTGVASTENIRTNTNATFLQNINVSGTSTVGGNLNIADKIVHIGDTDTAIRFASADTITAETGGSERLRIASNGRVGINETSPDRLLHISGGSGDAQIVLQRSNSASNTNDYGRIYFESNSDVLTGQISVARESGEDNGYMHFKTASGGTLGERLRITSGGVVQIGGETANAADIDTSNTKLTIKQSGGGIEDGIYLERTGERRGHYIYVGGGLSQSDALCVTTNQLGTDTDLLAIDRGGDIAVGAGDIFFTTSGKGIVLGATSNTDANTLDDYEEGSWTPTARNQGSFTSAIGRYVKIGQQVTVWGYIPTVTNNTSNDILQCSGLPFTVTSSGNTEMVGTLMIRFVASTSLSGVSFNVYTNSGRDYIEFYACRDDDNNYEAIKHSDLAYTNSNGIRFCLTYVV